MTTRRARHGFTLIEVMVAVFIFALLMLAAYGSVNALLRTRDGLAAQNERLRAMQFAVGLMERDLRAAIDRPVRGALGEREPALVGSVSALSLTRAGADNPLAQTRARIERIGYAVRDGHLSRAAFAVLDRTPASVPQLRDLLPGVVRVQFRYFDGSQWREQWPPSVTAQPSLHRMPKAVEFAIDTDDFGRILRWVDVPEAIEREAEAGAP